MKDPSDDPSHHERTLLPREELEDSVNERGGDRQLRKRKGGREEEGEREGELGKKARRERERERERERARANTYFTVAR